MGRLTQSLIKKSYRKIIAIAFFPCPLVDYIRIILVTWAVVIATLSRQPSHYQICCLLTVNVILDAVDGFLARRYNHQSGFGMALDLIVDVSTATVIWYLSSINLSFIFVLIEWVGAITILYSSFLKSSTHWKTSLNSSNATFPTIREIGCRLMPLLPTLFSRWLMSSANHNHGY